MNSHRWKQIKQTFEEATAKSESERVTFLDRACAKDAEMRREVESLLGSLMQSGKFLEPPVVSESPHDLNIGKHFGPYRIETLIGHGGMGAVYKAVRDDGQFQRQVAIKLVKPGVWSKELTGRFHQERQTLARLEHPNIAGLLDGGTTEDARLPDGQGTPYLVIEFVDGVSIDEYCDGKKLSIAGRLQLFRMVCGAVQYAHQNLIVHRDLKPSNILVTASSTPKLLDFGIAKLLNEAQQTEPSDITKVGFRFITLEYASPEQIKGDPVTTASDVYSLGVLLYKLLTGRSPYQFKNRLPHEMTRTICEQVPPKPSTSPQKLQQPSSAQTPDEMSSLRGVTPEKLRRQLSGDLDNIILKALQKDSHRRYASVEQFSEDIHRHLNGLPVLARPDTLGYRTSKFLQRHTIGVTASAVILLAVIGGVIGVLWQADKTKKEASKSEQINSFLQEMLSSADPAKSGKDVTVAQTLDVAVERVDKELGSQPEIAATLLHTIGETYIALGFYDKASVQLERAHKIFRSVFGTEHAAIARALHSLAYVAQRRGEYSRADSLYRVAIPMYRRAHAEPDKHLASMLTDWGTLLHERRETAAALPLLKEAAEIMRATVGKESRDYATSLSNLGPALSDNGEYAAAESVYRKALGIWKPLVGEEHIDVAQAMNNLAFVSMERGDLGETEKLFRQSLAIRRKVLGNDHPEVALGLSNLAAILLKKGNIDEAETLSHEALKVYKATVNPDNLRLSSSLVFLGRIANMKGDAALAGKYLREALEIRKKSLPPGHYGIVGTESELGKTLTLQKKYVEAERVLTQAYGTLHTTAGENHPATMTTLKYLVELYRDWGKKEKGTAYEAKLAEANASVKN